MSIRRAADPITDKMVRDILRTHLGHYYKGVRYYLADDYYRCPSLKTARDIVKKSNVSRRRYIAEKHDCDDFAHLMKAAFIRSAYTEKRRKYPYAFGIVWGRKPSHAMNLIVAEGRPGKRRTTGSEGYKVYVIEPQTGVFYRPEQGKLDEIYMIMM